MTGIRENNLGSSHVQENRSRMEKVSSGYNIGKREKGLGSNNEEQAGVTALEQGKKKKPMARPLMTGSSWKSGKRREGYRKRGRGGRKREYGRSCQKVWGRGRHLLRHYGRRGITKELRRRGEAAWCQVKKSVQLRAAKKRKESRNVWELDEGGQTLTKRKQERDFMSRSSVKR